LVVVVEEEEEEEARMAEDEWGPAATTSTRDGARDHTKLAEIDDDTFMGAAAVHLSPQLPRPGPPALSPCQPELAKGLAEQLEAATHEMWVPAAAAAPEVELDGWIDSFLAAAARLISLRLHDSTIPTATHKNHTQQSALLPSSLSPRRTS
jgi:hypothetical protein